MIVVVAACWTSPAGAVTVGIVGPARTSSVTSQALLRASAEMRALGLEPRALDQLDAGPAGGAPAGLPALAAEAGVDAVIAIRGTPLPTAVEVWAADGKGRSVARGVTIDPAVERAPQTIAIRAIELLRSCLLEIDLLAAPTTSVKVQPPAAERGANTAAVAAAPASPRFGLGAGAVLVMTTDRVGPAVLPYLRFDWRFQAAWLARAELAGAGTASTVDGAAGSARVTQDQALVGAVYQPFPGHRLRPLAGLSAGILRTVADGQALPQYDSQRAARWSFLMSGLAGASLGLGARWDLTAGLQVQAAVPYPAVRFLGQTVATAARPNLSFGLAVQMWL